MFINEPLVFQRTAAKERDGTTLQPIWLYYSETISFFFVVVLFRIIISLRGHNLYHELEVIFEASTWSESFDCWLGAVYLSFRVGSIVS